MSFVINNFFDHNRSKIRSILRYGILKAEVVESPGLYCGRLGFAIIFYEYSRYSGDLLFEQFADDILDSILELSYETPLDLENGLIGIKWGVRYLLEKEFIEGEIDFVLSDINKRINSIGYKENDNLISDEIILKNILEKCFCVFPDIFINN